MVRSAVDGSFVAQGFECMTEAGAGELCRGLKAACEERGRRRERAAQAESPAAAKVGAVRSILNKWRKAKKSK